jgi:ABC-type bacteriocin/lantibiotic exporter with double-glycine peptidase domain
MKRQVSSAWAAALLLVVGGSALLAAGGQNLWLDVPFVKQPPEGCGAAAISMVIRYWARDARGLSPADADPAAIQKQLFKPGARGITASEMRHYFEEKGFRTFAFRGEWKDLEDHLGKGRPLIVCLREGGALAHSLHYVVVVGLDDSQNVVLVNDPAGRKLSKLDQADFLKRWNAMDRWTLLAVPRQER